MSTAQENGIPLRSQLFWRLWRKLSKRRKTQVKIMSILLVFSAFAEIATIGAILPLIAILAAPDTALDQPIVAALAQILGITSGVDLRLPITLGFIVIILLSGLLRTIYLWISLRLSFAIGSDFAELAFWRSLHDSYEQQIQQNSGTVLAGINIKIRTIIVSGFIPVFTIFGAMTVCTAIITTLVVLNPWVAASAAALALFVHGSIVLITKGPLHAAGEIIARRQSQLITHMQTASGGIREVLLDETQGYFYKTLSQTERSLRAAQVGISFIASFPRYLMETVFLVGIAALTLFISGSEDGMLSALPLLSAFAVGAQKLLPAAQQIFQAWANIRANVPAMYDALELFETPPPAEATQAIPKAPLSFSNTLTLQDVSYKYTPDSKWALQNINLEIKKGERIGIIGQTGGGKSSLIDLIIGLLSPTKGQILVDGAPITGVLQRQWRKRVAHVPQTIFLSDTSISENIAFGHEIADIDATRVVETAHQADIAQFVDNESKGFDLTVGERGVQLSGGQRQRIGIARALYKNVDVMVLDEATSALDDATETRVMKTIEALGPDITIIMIAHRLTTLKNCDRIIELKDGQITRICRYEDI